MTREEHQATRNLQKNTSIIITPTDKGGSIVIQDIRDYKKKAAHQLRDMPVYQHMVKDKIPDKPN